MQYLITAAIALLITAAPLSVQAGVYCKTVIGEVEGFGKNSTRFAAERDRDEALAQEKARRREMGREILEIRPQETTCKAVYPLGFKEWYCVAKTDVCVKT